MSNVLTIDDMLDRYPNTNRQTWAQLRYTGKGPKFFKVGRKVFYDVNDLVAWEESQKRTSTGERPDFEGSAA